MCQSWRLCPGPGQLKDACQMASLQGKLKRCAGPWASRNRKLWHVNPLSFASPFGPVQYCAAPLEASPWRIQKRLESHSPLSSS